MTPKSSILFDLVPKSNTKKFKESEVFMQHGKLETIELVPVLEGSGFAGFDSDWLLTVNNYGYEYGFGYRIKIIDYNDYSIFGYSDSFTIYEFVDW